MIVVGVVGDGVFVVGEWVVVVVVGVVGEEVVVVVVVGVIV